MSSRLSSKDAVLGASSQGPSPDGACLTHYPPLSCSVGFATWHSLLSVSFKQNLSSLGADVCFILHFIFSRAAPAAYGSSQARGWIRAAAAGLHHSHSKTRSEPHLRLHHSSQQLRILNPLSEARDWTSWILVGFLTSWATRKLPREVHFIYGCASTPWTSPPSQTRCITLLVALKLKIHFFFSLKKKCTDVQWLYNVVLISAAQQSDSVVHIHTSILFQSLFS